MPRTLAARAMAAYLVVLFALTLGGFYQAKAPRNFVPFRTIGENIARGGPEFVVNVLGNLAAFVPMGWLPPSLLGDRCSAAKVAGWSLATSLLIEVLQGLSRWRVADVDDLILNTASGLIGYGLRLGFDRLRGVQKA